MVICNFCTYLVNLFGITINAHLQQIFCFDICKKQSRVDSFVEKINYLRKVEDDGIIDAINDVNVYYFKRLLLTLSLKSKSLALISSI